MAFDEDEFLDDEIDNDGELDDEGGVFSDEDYAYDDEDYMSLDDIDDEDEDFYEMEDE